MNKNSGIVDFKPKYRQLEDILRQRIKSGEYPVNSKIPTEHALVKEFKVSRHTVIKALNELHHSGLLIRRQGSGTFVNDSISNASEKIGILSYFEGESTIFNVVIKEISKAALSSANANVLLRHVKPDSPSLPDEINAMLADGVHGLVLFPQFIMSAEFPLIKHLLNNNIPFVTAIDEPTKEFKPQLNSVYGDNYHGGMLAGKHLLECGYDNFKVLMPIQKQFDYCCYTQRIAGFVQALVDAGIDDDHISNLPLHFSLQGSVKDAIQHGSYRAGKEFIKNMPEERTGVFAMQSDNSAIGFLHAMKENNIDVPGKIGICGYDNMEISRSWGVALTSIDTDVHKIGEDAVKILLEQIANPDKKPQSIALPEKLIARKTTGKV